MSSYRMAENAFISESVEDAPGDLFHSPRFFRLHAGDSGHFFEWTDERRVVASIHFTPLGNGTWRSPARGTYAGHAFARELPPDELMDFYDAVETRLVELGASRLEVLPAPMLHDTAAFSLQLYVLRSRGFSLGRCDINQSQPIHPGMMAMSRGNRRCLEKGLREGYACEHLESTALPAVYDVITANRSAKGYPVSMSLAQLEKMQLQLPEAMVLFGCRHRDDEELIAAALCLRLSPSKLYVFYWGDRPGYARLSPVVMLASALHSYCLEQGIALLDVGTSTEGAVPNLGLLKFKQGLGFETGMKVRMEKLL